MNITIAILLIALLVAGIGLFVRAYVQGMRFGDRLDAEKKASKSGTASTEREDTP